MKIIRGKLKGRVIKDYNIAGTRPTMDRVKESIFNSIQNYLEDSICLDLFAGSGNLGIEAISNGAKKCYFIDKNPKAINAIKNNIKTFNIEENAIIIKNDYKKFLENTDTKFDIIFLDPPYKDKIITDILNIILEKDLLNINGIVVCEYEFDNVSNDKLTLIKEKKYGSKYVKIYKKEN